MSQTDLKNAGYKIIQKAALVKCWSQERAESAYRAYAAEVAGWLTDGYTLDATIVQIYALCAVENG